MKPAFNHTSLKKLICTLAITGCLLAFTFVNGRSQSSGSLKVSFINVGQGDSALLQDPDGFDVLIDGGVASQGITVLNYLREMNVDDIDVLVVSHADADHVGGLLTVLQASDIPVQAVVTNGYEGTTQTWLNFQAAVAAEGLTPTVAQFPAAYSWGGMTAHVLNPTGGLINPETNDAALVFRIDYGDFNMLFAADIDTAVEAQVIARGTPLAAEVLKVAHHGSKYGSSGAFLAAVDPLESIISVGPNRYGHPAPETIQRILASGSSLWRTDRNGNIVISSDGITYTLSPEYIQRLLFLPVVLQQAPQPGGTVTPTSPATATPVTPTPVQNSDNIQIITVFADGIMTNEPDEYVEIQNQDSHAIQLQGWTLRDRDNHVYTFPAYEIQPGQSCRVYTDQTHPESCGFNYGSGSAIWNNSGDCAYLDNPYGARADSFCYP